IVAEGNQVKYYLKSPTDSAFVLKYTSTKTYDSAAEYFVDSSLIDQGAKIEGAVLGHNLGMSATTVRTSQSVYDARGQLVYSLDAAGYVTHQEYDAQGHVIRTTRYAEAVSGVGIAPTEGAMDAAVTALADSSRDQVTQFVYDDLGRLRFSLNAEGYVSETVYNGFNQVVEERQYAQVYTGTATHADLSTLAIDNATRITRYQYDARGQVIRQSQRLMEGSSETWVTESYTYDHAGNRTSVMDARGNTTSFAYDDNNRLIAKLSPRDSVDDSQVAAADRKGYVIRYRYDGFDNLLSETHYTTAVSVYEKTAADYVSDGVTLNNDAQGGDRTTRYEYDALNRQVRIYAPDVDGQTLVTRKDYDRFGNVVQLVSGEGLSNAQTSTYVFDDLNRVILETKAAGTAEASTTGYEYNGFGQITRVIDPRYYELTTNLTDWTKGELSRLKNLSVKYLADNSSLWASQQASWLSKYASTLSFLNPDYLPNGSHVQVLKDIYSHSQDFDRRGLKISETDGEGYTTSSDYDAFGNLIQSTDAEGNIGYFFYDELNRLTLQVDPAGYVQGYAYNASGQVVSKTAWNTPISTNLSGKTLTQVQSLVATDASNDRHTGSVFDTLGRVVEEQAQKTSSTVVSDHYTYDASGNRLSWTNRENQVTQYQYDAQGRRTATIHPSTTVVFNSDISNTAQRQLAEQVRYDAFGNKVAVTEGSYWDASSQSFKTITGQTRTTLFQHDKLNREVAVWSAVTDFDYYNTEGVLKSYSNVRQVTTREFDLFGNRLKETVQAYQIDGNGKPSSALGSFQKQLFEYDSLNHLVAQVDAAGGVKTFSYDDKGNRIRERQYGKALSPISNGNLATLLASGTDDYRELTSVYDLNNRVVETRTRAETHFDLALKAEDIAALAQGGSAGGLYDDGYSAGAIQTFNLYDRNGQLVAETDGRGNTTRYFYDKRGEKVAQLEAGVIHYDKDTSGSLNVSRHHALTTWKVSGFGQVTEEYRYAYEAKDPAMYATLDELKSNIAGQRSAAEAKAATLADQDLADLANEDVLASQVQADRRKVSDYDMLGRKVRDIVYNVNDYSLSGNAPVKTAATSRTTEYTYDDLDRLRTTIAPGDGGMMGRTTEIRYDELGRVTTELGQQFTDYRGVSVRATTTYGYDALGHAVSTTRHGSVDSEDQTQKVVYNLLGYVQSEEDATGAVTQFCTDIFGNAVEKQWTQRNADNTSTTHTYQYWYDAQNREIKHVDTTGLTYEVRYNGYGDIEAKGMNGQYQEQYKYDKLGRLFSTNKETGAPQLYLYDLNGNATAEFILVDENPVDEETNEVQHIDFNNINSPTDLVELSVLKSQMKVSVFDERNRLTDTFEAPHDYQKLTTQLYEDIADEGWKSGIDLENWLLTRTDESTVTFNEAGEPVFTGVDEVYQSDEVATNTTYEYLSSATGNSTPAYTPVGFEDFDLSEVQGALGLELALNKVGISYSDISLGSEHNSYQNAWTREVVEDKGIDASTGQQFFTKTIVRVWKATEDGNNYIYRDIETQNFQFDGSDQLTAEELSAASFGDGETYTVSLTVTREGQSVDVSGYRVVGHSIKRAQVRYMDTQESTKVGAPVVGSAQAIGRGTFTVNSKVLALWTNSLGKLGGDNDDYKHEYKIKRRFTMHIPEELQKLGVNLKIKIDLVNTTRNTSQELDLVTATVGTETVESEVTHVYESEDWVIPISSSSLWYRFKIYTPDLGNKVLFDKQFKYSETNNGYNETDTLTGLTDNNFILIEEPNNAASTLTGGVLLRVPNTIGSVGLDGAIKSGNRFYYAISITGDHYVSYITKDADGNILNKATFIATVGVGSGSTRDYKFEVEKVSRTYRQVADGASGRSETSGNSQQNTVIQNYRASYFLGTHNQYQIHRRQVYNAFGEVVTEVDGNGNETHSFYDTQGRLTHKIDPKVEVAQDHAVNGELQTLETHPVTRYYYDAQGHIVATEDANSYLNARDESYSIEENQGSFYRSQSFSGGLLMSETDATGATKTYQYDALGNRRVMIDSIAQYHSYTFDKANRLTASRNFESLWAYSHDLDFSYDEYEYDEQGNRIAHTNALGNREKYLYDGEARIVQHTSFAGRDTSYIYGYEQGIGDGLGGFTKTTITGLNTESDVNYQTNNTLQDKVDYFGRIREHRDLGGHQYVYHYNQAGWLISQTSVENDPDITPVASTYSTGVIPDDLGLRPELRVRNGQNIQYEYYNNGRVRRISDEGIGSYTDFRYDANGNVITETYSDGSLTGTSNPAPYQNVHATYDALGRVKTIEDSDQYSLEYFYDAVGNRRRVKTSYDNYTITGNQAGAKVQTQDLYYLYDKENRFTVTMGSLDGNGKIRAGNTGYELTYDSLGRRVSSNSALRNDQGKAVVVKEKYVYDHYGRVQSVWLYDANYLNKSGTGIRYNGSNDMGNGYRKIAYRQNDALGRMTNHYQYINYFDDTGAVKQQVWSHNQYQYDSDNRVITDTTLVKKGDSKNGVLTYTYLNDGETLKKTFYAGSSGEADVETKYYYNTRDRFDTYKQSKVIIDAIGDGLDPGVSYYAYNANGHNLFVYDHEADRSLTYINNHRGQIIQREDISAATKETSEVIRRKFYYLDGIVRGDMGNDDVPSRTDYVQHLANTGDKDQVLRTETHYWRGGNGDKPTYHSYQIDIKKRIGYSNLKRVVPVTSADFDQNYQPINPDYPAKSSSYYTVAQGDTLQGIAASQWGDSSLWYLIADANGLSGGEALTSGLNLVIPNVVTNVHNNAGTFRPYEPGLAIGDTTPTLPEPPPPSNGGKCGGAGLIVMIVAVAVTAIVAPYMAGAIADAVGAAVTTGGIVGTAGLGTLGASSIAASAAGFASVAAGGFIGGFVGSAASQLVAKELGVQEHFSLRSAIRGGLTTAATMAVGAYTNNAVAAAESGKAQEILKAGKLAELGQWTRTAANAITAATAVGANYFAGGITNTPRSFRWRDVATSFLSTTATTGLGKGFTGNALLDGGLKGALNSSFS
ncbi:hypothetical protein BTA51_28610, partial [Hahella sp. CCB-MM4]|uniref:LysM peptidoglycan-binding domain-containing protein n=1 Tax=Hahella sp. (strain CCB-MM4) TaxID=1926491 RepID=UPI000BD83884